MILLLSLIVHGIAQSASQTTLTATDPSSSSTLYPKGQNVFVPPDIKYWAYGKINTTVYDNLGLPWFCYTNLQTHCLPMFPVPPNFRTTRKPITAGVKHSLGGLNEVEEVVNIISEENHEGDPMQFTIDVVYTGDSAEEVDDDDNNEVMNTVMAL